ncbi:MAG: HAD family hydrolase [Candidatus Eisenbacteria bacterium]|nr:HAD family hydrolase [Candidatus Eisenbacteria bacterium]
MPPLHRILKGSGPAPLLWLDVDDTILDFTSAHPAGLRAVEHWARRHVGENRASKFTSTFDRGFQISFLGWLRPPTAAGQAFQAEAERRLAQVASEGPRPSRWSREIWLEMAADEAGARLPREALAEAAGEYWTALGGAQRLYEDVPPTLHELHAGGYRVALVTSSDSRLQPAETGWRYDPRASRDAKRRRLEGLLAPVRPWVERLVIGDPYEKTGPEFYEMVLREVPLESGGFVIAVGDSPEGDIRLARRAATAVRHGVLMDPHRRCPEGPPEGVDLRIESLHELLVHFF